VSVVVDDRVAVRGTPKRRDVAKARRTAVEDDPASSARSELPKHDHVAGIGRRAPNELHPRAGDLRRDPQDVRGPREMRRSVMLWLPARRVRGLGPRRSRKSRGSLGRRRPGSSKLEHHCGRPQLPVWEKTARGRPGGKDECRQHDRPRPATLGTRRRQRRELQPPAWRCARWLLRGRGPAPPPRLREIGEQLACLFGQNRIDQRELRAYGSQACKVSLFHLERAVDGWAGVHRQQSYRHVRSRRELAETARAPNFPLLATNSNAVLVSVWRLSSGWLSRERGAR
jgi:hypothetical protein